MTPRFRAVVLDADSTLAGIEGIDWLAARRGPAVAARIAELTDLAMRGELPLDAVYAERVEAIRPSASDVHALAEAYVDALAPDAADVVTALRSAGVRVAIVSGGIREALLPMARRLGVADADVRAVEFRFDAAGAYAGFGRSPLTTQTGKHVAIETLELPHPALGVGDGATDVHMRPAVDAFAAYTGWVTRAPVVAAADHVLDSFTALRALVLD